jgi:hypothetical protein
VIYVTFENAIHDAVTYGPYLTAQITDGQIDVMDGVNPLRLAVYNGGHWVVDDGMGAATPWYRVVRFLSKRTPEEAAAEAEEAGSLPSGDG